MATQSVYKERTENRIAEPKKYKVIMHNDDFTTMDFVVRILREIFQKDARTAENLMLTVHESGKAVVGIYPRDIAATKIQLALSSAKKEGFPFRMTMEEA